MKVVLQKYIASTGYASRRAAEKLIIEKRVEVNGVVAELGMKVGGEDEVRIDGKKLKVQKKIYIVLNKPAGYTCTSRVFRGEKNIFEFIDIKERLFVVGRLDKNSRGLILLTNDGDLAQKITHPKYEHEKKYEVIAECKTDAANKIVASFKKGVDIGEGDGVVAVKNIGIKRDESELKKTKFVIVLTQGKKRQIRRMFEVLKCRVTDLKRIQIANIRLDDLREADWKYIKKEDII